VAAVIAPRSAGPVRVLLAITDSHIGGTERVVSLLARNLDRSRYEPAVLSVKPAGDMAREVAAAGIEVVSLDLDSGGWRGALLVPGLIRRTEEIIRAGGFGLVHSFLFAANLIGRFAARRAGVPNISSIRAEETSRPRLLVERATRSRVDRYLVPSEYIAADASRRAGIPRSVIVVVANAVVPPSGRGFRLRPLLGVGPGLRLTGFVGRLHRQKGVDTLLKAWAYLPPDGRGVLVMIGDGPERASLERLAASLGVTESVRFPGWMKGARDLLGELDLFVLPSRYEGTPNGILEAMAAGVPVIAAAVSGVPEMVEDGVTGRLVPPDDPVALAAALAGSRGDEETRMMVAAARRRVLERTPEGMAARVADLYDDVLGRSAR
jgi:glycosyltransferase involved in cell wall biosynthesis